MKVLFSKKAQRTVTYWRIVDLEEFIEIMTKHKPTEIRCDCWSSKMPIYVITEYLQDNRVMAFCNSYEDKSPSEITLEDIYKSLRYGGLSDSYIVAM